MQRTLDTQQMSYLLSIDAGSTITSISYKIGLKMCVMSPGFVYLFSKSDQSKKIMTTNNNKKK